MRNAVDAEHFLFEVCCKNEEPLFLTDKLFSTYVHSKRFNFGEVTLVSNLGDCWENNSPNTSDISNGETDRLATMIDKARPHTYYSAFICIDFIKWSNNTIAAGTYGFGKAKSIFDQGINYLSNSVIIAKEPFRKGCHIILSAEEAYCETEKYKSAEQMIITLSSNKVVDQIEYFAPDSEEDREKFNLSVRAHNLWFENLKKELIMVYNQLPHQLKYDPNVLVEINSERRVGLPKLTKINISGLLEKLAKEEGWHKRTVDCRSEGLIFEYCLKDLRLAFIFRNTYRGHYLQSAVEVNTPFYNEYWNTEYNVTIRDEEDARKYVDNTKMVMGLVKKEFLRSASMMVD